MKNISFGSVLVVLIVLSVLVSGASPNYVIDGDMVYIDKPAFRLEVTPHTLKDSGFVYLTLISKTLTGQYDFIAGFPSEFLKPKGVWIWRPLFNNTVFDWVQIDAKFSKIYYQYADCDVWFYIKGLQLSAPKTYKLKVWLDMTPQIRGGKQKYCLGAKPSALTLQEAKAQDKIYLLDPWWNSDWAYKQSVVIEQNVNTGENWTVEFCFYNTVGTSSGNTGYLGGNASDNFDDLRVLNSTEDGVLFACLVEPYTTTHGHVWVKIEEDLSADDVTIFFYYGNAEASSSWDGENTFLFYDDFEDNSIDSNKWATENTPQETGGQMFCEEGDDIQSKSENGHEWGLQHAIISYCRWDMINPYAYREWGFGTDRIKHGYGDAVTNWHYGNTGWETPLVEKNDGGPLTCGFQPLNETWEWRNIYRNDSGWARSEAVDPTSHLMKGCNLTDSAKIPTKKLNVTYMPRDSSYYSDFWIEWVAVINFTLPYITFGAWTWDAYTVDITFYFNTGGEFRVDNDTVSNGEMRVFLNGSILELVGVTLNASYYWISFNASAGTNSTSNPYNYTLVDDANVWCWFNLTPTIPPVLPFCTILGHNTSLFSSVSLLYATLNDSAGLSHFAFSHNVSGSWVNETFAEITGNPTGADVNDTISLPADWNETIGFKVYFNNTAGEWGDSTTDYLFGVDDPPTKVVTAIIPIIFVGFVFIMGLIAFTLYNSRRKGG